MQATENISHEAPTRVNTSEEAPRPASSGCDPHLDDQAISTAPKICNSDLFTVHAQRVCEEETEYPSDHLPTDGSSFVSAYPTESEQSTVLQSFTKTRVVSSTGDTTFHSADERMIQYEEAKIGYTPHFTVEASIEGSYLIEENLLPPTQPSTVTHAAQNTMNTSQTIPTQRSLTASRPSRLSHLSERVLQKKK